MVPPIGATARGAQPGTPAAQPAGRHLHLDCSSGIAGDMLLAALLDTGAGAGTASRSDDTAGCLDSVREALGGLRVPGVSGEDAGDGGGSSARAGTGDHTGPGFTIDEVTRHGLRGLLIQVAQADVRIAETGDELLNLISSSPLDEAVKTIALRASTALIGAETAAHGSGRDPHLHEVGSLDTLVDVVGVAAAVTALGITTVTCSPIAVGSGRVSTSHGSLPVPAPATAHLLTGLTIEAGPPTDAQGTEAGGELTTPTGAALLSALGARSSEMPQMELSAVGVGAGSRELAHPNLLRAFIGAGAAGRRSASDIDPGADTGADAESAPATRELTLLEADIDDARPDRLAHITGRLLAEGARDAWITPVTMKKGRPGHLLSVLCDPSAARPLAMLLFLEGITLGIREQRILRHELERRVVDTLVDGHIVRVKIGMLGSRMVRVRAEHDDVAAAAAAGAGSMDEIAREAEGQARTPTAQSTKERP